MNASKFAFHLGLHCLLILKKSENELDHDFEILTCNPLICTMEHPMFIVPKQMEETISKKE